MFFCTLFKIGFMQKNGVFGQTLFNKQKLSNEKFVEKKKKLTRKMRACF